MPAEPRRPAFSEQDARSIARDLYGIDARISELPSYDDLNFHLETVEGEELVLKIANRAESKAVLDFQNCALQLLAGRQGTPMTPRVCKTLVGNEITAVEDVAGKSHCVRMLTFVKGAVLADRAPLSGKLLQGMGRLMGRVDLALQGFTHPAMNRCLLWDLKEASRIAASLPAIESLSRRSLAELTLRRFDALAAPRIGALRTGVIHNDGNAHNLLVHHGSSGGMEICGIIDFGDLVHTCIVFEPAIAAAYGTLGQDDPLHAATKVVAGFHEVYPLEPEEVHILLPLICARLCTSVCEAARQSLQEPENTYLRVNERPAWDSLEKLASIDPRRAEEAFLEALQMSASSTPDRARVSLRSGANSPGEIMAIRKRHLGRSLSASYKKPLKIVRGSMQYLYDQDGRAYLDAVNNVAQVGHCHPRVVEAAREQNARLNTNTRYLHDHIVNYAQALTATMPDPLSVCFFVNSGSEANDLALRLARAHTAREDIVVVDGAYHGNLASLIDISPYKFDGPGGGGAPAHVHKTPMPDPYRGPYRGTDPEAGVRYASCVKDAIARSDQTTARLPERGLPPRPRSGGGGNRRRGAGGIGARGLPLLGLRSAGRGARHLDPGQAHRQRPSPGVRGDHTRDRRLLRHGHGVLQYLRREPRIVCGGPRRARCDRGGEATGECPGRWGTPDRRAPGA